MRLTIDRFGRIVIPKRLRERLGLHPGTEVELEPSGETLVVRAVVSEPVLQHEGAVLVARVTLR
jgi:AbrB family looped-hinge helix DNA binding protein